MNKTNIIYIQNMLNSSIQQDADGNSVAMLPEDNLKEIVGFLDDISTEVEVRHVIHSLVNSKSNAKNLVTRYHKQLLNELAAFSFERFSSLNTHEPWGKHIIKVADEMIPLRNRLLELYFALYEYDSGVVNIPELLRDVLQFNFLDYEFTINNPESAGHIRNDIYRIFNYEVFTYLSAYLIKEQKIDDLNSLVKSNYQVKCSKGNNGNSLNYFYKTTWFSDFNQWVQILEGLNTGNPFNVYYREFIVGRAKNFTLLTLNDIQQADTLLYFLSVIHHSAGEHYFWTPNFYTGEFHSLDIFLRATSIEYFDKVKRLLQSQNRQELLLNIDKLKQNVGINPWLIEKRYVSVDFNTTFNLKFIETQN